MELMGAGISGTMESSDIMVTIKKNDEEGIHIQLTSIVEKQFGDVIRNVIADTLGSLDICSARVEAVDKGALDCTIRARVTTAAYRACGHHRMKWETGR
ncbi:MAG: citrate lyase acyl carrier protein [Spirochaetia bacterium]|nr:citrate lyase acyl carrier protein [Spirochaetia bacterium]